MGERIDRLGGASLLRNARVLKCESEGGITHAMLCTGMEHSFTNIDNFNQNEVAVLRITTLIVFYQRNKSSKNAIILSKS